MLFLELLCSLWTQDLKHKQYDICYVALNKLVNKCRPGNLPQDRIYLVGLSAHILKDLVHFGCVQ